jgi:hypothetical protein
MDVRGLDRPQFAWLFASIGFELVADFSLFIKLIVRLSSNVIFSILAARMNLAAVKNVGLNFFSQPHVHVGQRYRSFLIARRTICTSQYSASRVVARHQL